jgi:Raf kinase inhibitor-like YbhB/YbcL family protein
MHSEIHDKEFKALTVSSSAFKENQTIPVKYTCMGDDINPPLEISHIPDEARSLALIVDDPDAPVKTWVHWIVWNIPITHHIEENTVPGQEGKNDFGKTSWGGPCPPGGTHRYFFKVYALDTLLKLSAGANKQQLEQAMHGHILAYGSLMGLFSKAT